MKPTVNKTLFSMMALIFLLAGCFPATQPPTQNPTDVANQVGTSVALTVAAQNTQTAAAATVAPPATNTPLPTQTEPGSASPTPLIPTATPFEVVPPTSTQSSSSGGGVVYQKKDYACDIIRRRPFDNSIFKPNKDFDIKWTIVNTGAKAWPAGFDLKYFSGPQMSAVTRIELPAMDPGEQFDLILDAVSPSKEGFHVMTWTIDGQICYPYVAIIVEK